MKKWIMNGGGRSNLLEDCDVIFFLDAAPIETEEGNGSDCYEEDAPVRDTVGRGEGYGI